MHRTNQKYAESAVSVIIPCYNQGRFLTQAIDSALSQTYRPREIIVIDDGSTDQTRAVATAYQGRVTYLFQANAGVSAARNAATRLATGAYLHFLDADDALAPDMLAHQMAAAEGDPSADVLYGDWRGMDTAGTVGAFLRCTRQDGDAFHALLRRNLGPPACITWRRAVVENNAGFDETLSASEDWDFCLKAAAGGARFRHVPGSVTYYRNYPGTVSRDYRLMWDTGRSVLSRYRRSHADCALCRRASAAGLRLLRHYCVHRGLVPEFRRRMARNAPREAFALIHDPLRRDPLAAPMLLRGLIAARLKRTPLL